MKNRLHLVLAVSILAGPVAHSQIVDTSAWICEFCPFESGHRADIAVGASSVSDESAYIGDAVGYDDDGVYANVDGDGSLAGNKHRLQWHVEDLGLDSRSIEFRGGRPGTYNYSAAYRQVPRYQFFTTDTVFLQSGSDTLVLPAGWVRAPVTSGFTALSANLARQDIESERRILQLGGKYRPSGRFTLSADYRRQERSGHDVYGGAYFTQSSLLPRPFDYVTDIVEFGVRYATENGLLALDYYASDFDNNDTQLRWENPFISAPGSEFAALAVPPDNQFQQVSFSGNFGFPKYKTTIGFSAAMGRIEQNDTFLPYTTNPNLTVNPLPRSSLDADVDTTNFSFALRSRAFGKALVKIAYRYDERNNKTVPADWNRVIADSFVSGETETNSPYSFERSSLNLSATYDLFRDVQVSGAYDRKTIDRDFQEVAEQTEDSGWGRLRWRPNGSIAVDVRAGASERDIDRYSELLATNLGQNPLLRKYNLAYRYRRFGDFTIVVSPSERPVSLSVNGLYADDDYTQSLLGLTSGDDLRFSADVNWAYSDNTSLYVTGSYENIESEQLGSESFALPDWQANHEDDFYTFGGGLRVRQIADKFDLQVDYVRSDGTSAIALTSAGLGVTQFPDLESKLDYVRLRLSYQRTDRLSITMNLRYQSFSAEDWALEGVDPVTIPVVLSLGANPYDDNAVIVGVGFRYRIGGAENASAE